MLIAEARRVLGPKLRRSRKGANPTVPLMSLILFFTFLVPKWFQNPSKNHPKPSNYVMEVPQEGPRGPPKLFLSQFRSQTGAKIGPKAEPTRT